jgi:putative heme-binding domain-containing protein
MLWYGIEPLVGNVGDDDLRLMGKCRIPLVQRCIARRITEQDGGLARIVDWLAKDRPGQVAATDIMAGMRQALEGRRGIPMPDRWPVALSGILDAADEQTRADAMFLALLFDDDHARQSLTATARNTNLEPSSRRQALASLIAVPNPSLRSEMLALLDDPDVADLALRGLAYFDDVDVADQILARYDALNAEQQQTAVATLAAHASSALALVAALESGTISREDVSAYVARQLLEFDNAELSRRLQDAWGQVRASSADRRQRLESYATELTTDALASADASRGRALFQQHCAKCHKLFGEGASIGPDLTGAQRHSVEYLLGNLVDPSAAVPREYRMHTVLTTDGRLINGVMPAENERTITLQTPTERIVIDRADIEELQPSNVSMMPEGLLDQMTPEQRRDLFAWLMSKRTESP